MSLGKKRQGGRAYLGAGPGRGRSTGFRVAMVTPNLNPHLGGSRTLAIEKRDMAASTSTGAILRNFRLLTHSGDAHIIMLVVQRMPYPITRLTLPQKQWRPSQQC